MLCLAFGQLQAPNTQISDDPAAQSFVLLEGTTALTVAELQQWMVWLKPLSMNATNTGEAS
jgi:hypothetical protein